MIHNNAITYVERMVKAMKYEQPIWELIELQTEDIVCTSPEEPGLGGGTGGDNDDPWGQV